MTAMRSSPEGERNASLELLRLLCMLAIIAYHYMLFGGYEALSWQTLDAGRIFIQEISLFGRLSCSIFALISGFFLIVQGNRFHGRKILTLAGEMCFYSVTIWAVLTGLGIEPFSIASMLRAFLPFIHGNWYAAHYILLLLLVPFLNTGLQAISQAVYQTLLVIIMIMWSVIPTLAILSGGAVYSFGNLDFLLVMYLTGGYIRLYVHGKVRYDNRRNLLLGAAGGMLLMTGTLGCDALARCFERDSFLYRISLLLEYNSIPSVLCAVFIFLYFSNLSFHSKVVERASSGVLGVYLIHENQFLRPWLWTRFFPNAQYADAPYFHALLKIFGIFFVCLSIDFLRSVSVGRIFERWLDRNYDHCVNRLKAFAHKISGQT